MRIEDIISRANHVVVRSLVLLVIAMPLAMWLGIQVAKVLQ